MLFVMREAVQEMYADSMNRAGSGNVVRFSVLACVTWSNPGRGDRLVRNLRMQQRRLMQFAAVIGTPVPAVIATDYRALQRMCEKKTNLPILTVDTNGMELYDVGEEKAWLTLFKTFAGKGVASQKEVSEEDDSSKKMKIGVLGLTPHDVSDLHVEEKVPKIRK